MNEKERQTALRVGFLGPPTVRSAPTTPALGASWGSELLPREINRPASVAGVMQRSLTSPGGSLSLLDSPGGRSSTPGGQILALSPSRSPAARIPA